MKAAHENTFLTSTKRDPAFLTKGFTYWKEANSAFDKPQTSNCHREANEAIVLPKRVCGDISELLSTQQQEVKATNRNMF